MIMRIKVCGITNPEDASVAVRLGTDAVGLIFYETSPRFVSIEKALEIAQVVNPFVPLVGVFVDASKRWVSEVCKAVPLHILQFHGTETESYCRSFQKPYIKSIAMTDSKHIQQQLDQHKKAPCLLFDSISKEAKGGTGIAFDMSLLPDTPKQKRILAGGLNVENLRDILSDITVDAVDINSGVESSPGVKDYALLTQAIVQIKSSQIKKRQSSFISSGDKNY